MQVGTNVSLLMHTDSKKLRWPNSPLRILLQFVDTNVRLADSPEGLATEPTPRHHLAFQVDPRDHSNHINQVILGQQLFRHGANANLDELPNGFTPLHLACSSSVVTNLDFIQLLLEKGASPNVQDSEGMTPLMCTITMAPGAAKILLEWFTPPTTDIDILITNRAGVSFVDKVHSTMAYYLNESLVHDHRVKDVFLLQQWLDIGKMLRERGPIDTAGSVAEDK
jgi:hypothetical protein